MKTKIIILAVLFSFIGCSSSTEEPVNPIAGIWKLTSIVTLGQEFINSCKSKDQIEINSNKTFTITSHNEDSKCAATSSSGNWVFVSGNTYQFSAVGDTQTFTLLSDNKLSFSIELNSNPLIYTYTKE